MPGTRADERRRRGRTAATFAALLSVSALAVFAASVGILHATQNPEQGYRASPFLRIDPDKIVVANSEGFQPCGECHTPEWNVWKETKHATGFATMHASEAAQPILEAMQLSTTKRGEALCMRCHYTVGPSRKAVAGVSCESCHGPARDWVNVHNTWGGGAADRASETGSGRQQRVAASRAAGMLRPSSDIYGVAANCFECHTVPMENLVNVGQHKAGTSGFELVEYVNRVRHNFLDAPKTGGANRPIAPERARVMFVVGRMLAYEYALRGLAGATAPGAYSSSMARRAKEASKQLSAITSVAAIPSVTQALQAGAKARLIPNNRAELESAAMVIRVIGEQFVATNTGANLAALDPAVAGQPLRPASVAAETEAPAPRAAASASETRAPAPSATTPAAPATPTSTPAADAPGSRGAAPAVPAVPAIAPAPAAVATPQGAIRPRPEWHTAEGRSGFAPPGECAGCHQDADAKMSEGPHQNAAVRLTGENAKARQIATAYGLRSRDEATAPGRICMSCHGTVDQATKEVVETAVTCESCHGAGADYLDPHKKGGNPQAGMRNLKHAKVRAQVCADCHRITDERLLASGHPDGSKKDFIASLAKIKHWPSTYARLMRARQARGQSYTELSDAALREEYAAIARSRPIPQVTVVVPPSPTRRVAAVPTPAPAVAPAQPDPSGAQTTPPGAGTVAPPPARTADEGVSPPAPSRYAAPLKSAVPPAVPTKLLRRAPDDNVSLQLEPLPPIERLTTEEMLLLVKDRIARVHSAIRRASQQP